jgi:hypothetical protein
MIEAAIKELLRGYPRCANISIFVGEFEKSEYEIKPISKVSQTLSGLLGNSNVPPPEKNLVLFLKEEDAKDIDPHSITNIAAKYSVVPYGVAESISGQAILEHAINWQVEYSRMYVIFKKDLWKATKNPTPTGKLRETTC